MGVVRSDEAGPEPGPDAAAGMSLESLFLALESPLLQYAMRLVRIQETAEDVVQEAFLRLQAVGAEVREPRRWLFRTVHNLALNHLRTGTRWVPLVVEGGGGGDVGDPPRPVDVADPAPLPDEMLTRLEGVGLVRLGLERLDARSRRVVELKFRENLSYQQIAESTGLTTGHVGYLLHHALRQLADELARSGLLP